MCNHRLTENAYRYSETQYSSSSGCDRLHVGPNQSQPVVFHNLCDVIDKRVLGTKITSEAVSSYFSVSLAAPTSSLLLLWNCLCHCIMCITKLSLSKTGSWTLLSFFVSAVIFKAKFSQTRTQNQNTIPSVSFIVLVFVTRWRWRDSSFTHRSCDRALRIPPSVHWWGAVRCEKYLQPKRQSSRAVLRGGIKTWTLSMWQFGGF